MAEIRITGTKEELDSLFSKINGDEDIRISQVQNVRNEFYPNQIGKNAFMGYINISFVGLQNASDKVARNI
ncbi:MAG: hypothetical protein R3Y32_06855 [Bacillota bacterium]